VRYGQHHAAGPLSSSSEQQQQQQQQQQLSGVRVSRTLLVVWLRAALDVLAALTHVDPAAVLMELSHKLAGVWEGGWHVLFGGRRGMTRARGCLLWWLPDTS
jgi:hypothetical protein